MKPKTLKIGHRGAMAYVTENTIESIKKALSFGVDGVEVDVHVCASGELVVFHDFTLDRITSGTGEISKFTLSELKQLRVKNEFQIPSLEEVLDLLDAKYLINIELKGKNTAQKTCEIIQYYINKKGWSYNLFLVSSFQHHELEAVFNIDKKIPLGILTDVSITDAIEFAETIKVIAIHPDFTLLTSENVKIAQKKGYKVNTWTVNDIETIERVYAYGVDAIISDYPDRL
jgi:glycerophosphoryl diester phosphodiesterase